MASLESDYSAIPGVLCCVLLNQWHFVVPMYRQLHCVLCLHWVHGSRCSRISLGLRYISPGSGEDSSCSLKTLTDPRARARHSYTHCLTPPNKNKHTFEQTISSTAPTTMSSPPPSPASRLDWVHL